MCYDNTIVKPFHFQGYNQIGMPRKLKTALPPLQFDQEPIGERIARFRKQKGLTQAELAQRIGIQRTLITDYEIGRLRLNADMIIRLAIALNISSDAILGLAEHKHTQTPDLKLTRRFKDIQKLPPSQKRSLLNTIDAYLKANSNPESDSA